MRYPLQILFGLLTLFLLLLPNTSSAREDDCPEWAQPVSQYVLEVLKERGPYFTLTKEGKIRKLGVAKEIIQEEDGGATLIFKESKSEKIIELDSDELFVSKKTLYEIWEWRQFLEIQYG